MSEHLTRADVERIAALARLRLTAVEADRFASQLTDILTFARQVQAVDTTGVAPFDAGPVGAPMRSDEPEPPLDRDEVMAQAPDAAGGLFKVPRVLGS
jgi:aspartyl-tRNA(Asn)/glutamyl-tRNA(Gln) amidotransferase subunit C